MRLFLLLPAIISFLVSHAQIGTGQWRMHIPASQAIDAAAGNGYVMAALNGGLLEYDIEANENRILNKLNMLSDIDVSCIAYDPASLTFFVGYENGNIDQVSASGAINIPAVKQAPITGSKRINKIVPSNGLVYVATGFSVVVINPAKHEVKDTYYPTNGSEAVNDVLFANDSIYALSNTRLFRGKATNVFLADPNQWTPDTRVPLTVDGVDSYGTMGVKDNIIYISHLKPAFGSDFILKLTNSGLQHFIGDAFDMEIKDFEVRDGLFCVYFNDKEVSFDENLDVIFGVEKYGNKAAQPKRVLSYAGKTWVADDVSGLVRYQDEVNYTFIQQEGPPKNNFFSGNGIKEKIVFTGGVIDAVTFEYSLAGAYAFKNEAWTLFDVYNQTMWKDKQVWDIGLSAVNSKNTDQIALAGYCIDALSIINDGAQVSELYNADNSILQKTSLGNGYVCMTGLEYDEKGNLWMLNSYTGEPLKVLTSDGQWQKFDTGGETKNRFTSKLVIDYNNNKWFSSAGVGLVGFNDNDTPENAADDTYKLLKTGEGNGNLPSENVTAIAVDFDNEIWVGTESGFAVLYNSDGIFTAAAGSYDASRILITYEGNVENLLGNTSITDIEIDGGNRKWIATVSTGIFLLSADGQEVIQQFTTENSPLISNNIMDMEFNNITGELFIVTDEGLVSLRTDASYEDPEYASTTVFPNPVKPDFTGPVTIQGIRYNSDVKITDMAGKLIYKTTSNGGTATWNGKTLTGEEVTSGVYLIWTATNEGRHRKVGKVTVIR